MSQLQRAEREKWDTVVFVPKNEDLPSITRAWCYITHTGIQTLPILGYLYLTPPNPHLQGGMRLVENYKTRVGMNQFTVVGIIFSDGERAGKYFTPLNN